MVSSLACIAFGPKWVTGMFFVGLHMPGIPIHFNESFPAQSTMVASCALVFSVVAGERADKLTY